MTPMKNPPGGGFGCGLHTFGCPGRPEPRAVGVWELARLVNFSCYQTAWPKWDVLADPSQLTCIYTHMYTHKHNYRYRQRHRHGRKNRHRHGRRLRHGHRH